MSPPLPIQLAREQPANMNFTKNKVTIFLLTCESLQLSVRTKRNAFDRLCLWIENVKIAEEKQTDLGKVRGGKFLVEVPSVSHVWVVSSVG